MPQAEITKLVKPLAQTNGSDTYPVNGYHMPQAEIDEAEIDWDAIIIEDDAPVENYATEEHFILLESVPYTSWQHSIHDKRFMVATDIGIFYEPHRAPIVPDVFLSLGVNKPSGEQRAQHKRYRSYFVWEVHKVPEVVIEIVSNDEGGEDTTKLAKYAELGILYYAIFDPYHELNEETLRFYRLHDGEYVATTDTWMPEVELGLTLWQGRFQAVETEWLRWCDQKGNVLPTGEELAAQERNRADRLAAKLLELGLSADELDKL